MQPELDRGFRASPDDRGATARETTASKQTQEVDPHRRYGIKGGWNRSWSDDPGAYPTRLLKWPRPIDRMAMGVVMDVPLTGVLGLVPEPLYSGKGGEFYDSRFDEPMTGTWDSLYDLTTRYEAEYLELPISVKARLPLGGFLATTIHGGLYAALLVGESLKHIREYPSGVDNGREVRGCTRTTEGGSDLRTFESGYLSGAGIEFTVWSHIVGIDIRFTTAFDDASVSGPKLRNRVASIAVGIMF